MLMGGVQHQQENSTGLCPQSIGSFDTVHHPTKNHSRTTQGFWPLRPDGKPSHTRLKDSFTRTSSLLRINGISAVLFPRLMIISLCEETS
eukprot:scaffold27073_cov135-Skeletonema_menzelii.AAC.3